MTVTLGCPAGLGNTAFGITRPATSGTKTSGPRSPTHTGTPGEGRPPVAKPRSPPSLPVATASDAAAWLETVVGEEAPTAPKTPFRKWPTALKNPDPPSPRNSA